MCMYIKGNVNLFIRIMRYLRKTFKLKKERIITKCSVSKLNYKFSTNCEFLARIACESKVTPHFNH